MMSATPYSIDINVLAAATIYVLKNKTFTLVCLEYEVREFGLDVKAADINCDGAIVRDILLNKRTLDIAGSVVTIVAPQKKDYMTSHWNTLDQKEFVLREDFILEEQLPPDIYKIEPRRDGLYFCRVTDNSDELLRFSTSSVVTEAVSEINKFWEKRDFFRNNGFPFCRGILLHGPQGSGKSCTARMIIKDVVARGGIAVIIDNIYHFTSAMSTFRSQQPETPVVAVIEDIERLTADYDYENELLQVLDGIGGFDGVVYLATTNFIEKLAARIKNRPSRFDRKFLVDYPIEKARFEYLDFLSQKGGFDFPLEDWARDSEGLSYAHLKELFVSVACFELDYKESIERLKKMGLDKEDEDDDDDEYEEECAPQECKPDCNPPNQY